MQGSWLANLRICDCAMPTHIRFKKCIVCELSECSVPRVECRESRGLITYTHKHNKQNRKKCNSIINTQGEKRLKSSFTKKMFVLVVIVEALPYFGNPIHLGM